MFCRSLITSVLALLLAGCSAEPPPADSPAGAEDGTATVAPVSPRDAAGRDAETEIDTGAVDAGSGEPAGAPPPAGAPEPEPEPPRAADCSAASVSGDLPAQPELPAAVAARREAIFAAAVACDFAALDELAPPELRYTFGPHEDAVATWRAAEERGEPVLRWMARVLRAAPGQQHGLWVWPAFFIRPVDEWTAADRRQAQRLLGDDLELLTGTGAYLGYRLGIAADGTWQYFVAGD